MGARVRLACALLAMSAMAGAQQSAPTALASTPAPEGPEEDTVNWWPFILLSVILVLSITFETVKEVIEHHTPHVFEPITDAFFGELATLGFIGAIAFTLTYNFSGEGSRSVMQQLSERVLGEPMELQEVFEALHFMLFAVSVIFIFVVLALLSMTLKSAASYEELEDLILLATKAAAGRRAARNSNPQSPHKRSQSPVARTRSKSPGKRPAAEAGAAFPSPASQAELEDTIRGFAHSREQREENEASLMATGHTLREQESRARQDSLSESDKSKPATPAVMQIHELLQGGAWGESLIARRAGGANAWWNNTVFEHFFKPEQEKRAEYFRLRHRFIDDEVECFSQAIPHDFNFGLYLKKTLAHSYAHIIEIAPVDWGVLWLVMGLLYTLYTLEPSATLVLFAANEVALLILAWAVLGKVIRIRTQLVPPGTAAPRLLCSSRPAGNYVPPSLDLIDEGSAGVQGTRPLLLDTVNIPPANEDEPKTKAGQDKSLSSKTGVRLEQPPYIKHGYQFYKGVTVRERVLRFIYGSSVNSHQSLFWFGAHGSGIMMHLVKLMLFASVVNLGVFTVHLRATVFELPVPVYVKYALAVAALLLPLLTLATMPISIGYINLVTCVEKMKKDGPLTEVIKEQKHARNTKAMQVLLSLQYFLDSLGSAEGGEGAAASNAEEVDRRFKELSADPENADYIQQLQLLFHKFSSQDLDSNIQGYTRNVGMQQDPNELSLLQLGELLACMGQQKSPDELYRLFNLMDADGSNGVSFEEFCTVMVANKKGRSNINPHDMAEKMYAYFDADGDGEVSPDEMLDAFQKMGKNWDVDDIRSFLETIDSDGSGTIEKHEFTHFITSFLSQDGGH